MKKLWPCLGVVVLAALVAGGAARERRGSGDVPPPAAAQAFAEPVGRGGLVAAAELNRFAASEIEQASSASGRQAPAVAPRFDVINHRLIYTTIDGQGRTVRASGLVSVPLKPPGVPSPVLSYQHGTLFSDAQAPSNHAVASEVAVLLASMGYIVVAADYVGYGASRGMPHPYLLAEPSAAAVLDLLTAAQAWRRDAGIADNGQLFLAGYSEGGYVTLAAQRAMQADDSPHRRQLVVSVAGGGPYDVGLTVSEQLREVRKRVPLIGPLFRPAILEGMGRPLRREARRWLVRRLVPRHADVTLQPSFLDHHFDGDRAATERLSNVVDWTPEAPVRLFHGDDDRTVPVASAERALLAMRSRGPAPVSLTHCAAVPSSHRNCVLPFFEFMLAQFAQFTPPAGGR